jgi:hypothetical protein
MKRIILLFFVISVCGVELQTQIHQYYPLNVGNVWVYQFGGSSGQNFKIRKSVSASTSANGHMYFYFENAYIRVDSVNGNIYQLTPGTGCAWNINEKMIDSLTAKLSDTVKSNCGNIVSICVDTNIRQKFGINRFTKHFRGNPGIVYAKGLGNISSYGGSNPNLWGMELLGCVIDGIVYGDTSMLTGISNISSEIPESFSLSQNYPNPFNPVTNIRFSIPQNETTHRVVSTSLIVYDALGRETAVLVNQQLQPGTYEVDWEASNFPSGVYYYKLEASSYTETKKMILIK